jgi:hypothetical protein
MGRKAIQFFFAASFVALSACAPTPSINFISRQLDRGMTMEQVQEIAQRPPARALQGRHACRNLFEECRRWIFESGGPVNTSLAVDFVRRRGVWVVEQWSDVF